MDTSGDTFGSTPTPEERETPRSDPAGTESENLESVTPQSEPPEPDAVAGHAEEQYEQAVMPSASPTLGDSALAPAPYQAPSYAAQQIGARFDANHFGRRRRRYTMYLRRTTRVRASARSSIVARAAWITVVALLTLTVAVLVTSLSAAAAYYQSQQVSVAALSRTVTGRDSVRIYDRNGALLYQLNNFGAQHSIPIAKMPIDVINATVAIEDHTFWTNPGIDLTSIIRAFQANASSGHISQGGSTITQQLIKQNILGANETYQRKLQEAILAVGMTATGTYSKQQILEMYLNSIDYGHEAYGIDSAAEIYFGYQSDPRTGLSAAQHLDLAQASLLAGIPQNPNTNDPIAHFATAHQRQLDVLNGMVKYGYITQAQANAAWAESAKPGFFSHFSYGSKNLAPSFVYFVIDQLQAMIASGQLSLSRTGLNVYTTLDLDLQNHVEAAIKKHLYGNDRDDYRGVGYIRNDHVTNSAGIMVDQHTGSIVVMQGSVDYYSSKINGQFNVVTQGYRSAGSSFKPIVYATAFSKGWFPAMTISDTPTVFWDAGAQKPYKPLDFNYNVFSGEITLRTALQNSLNIPAVKVMQYAGISDVERNAIRMGLRTWQGVWGLSSVLGTLDVTPYDMAQIYTVFANYGQFIPLHAIDRITDSSNNVMFQYVQPRPVQVLSPQVAFMISNVLSDNGARTEFGLCSPLYLDPLISPDLPGYITSSHQGPIGTKECYSIYGHGGYSPNAWPAAVKTGTAQNFTDDWTVGYTMDYTMAVWAGNNDHTPMNRIDGITGSAPTWYRSMLYAEERDHLPKRAFPVPAGMQRAKWTSNGVTTTDWFMSGALPANNIGSTGANFTPCFTNNESNPWNFCPATSTTSSSSSGSSGAGGGGGSPPGGGGTAGGGGRKH